MSFHSRCVGLSRPLLPCSKSHVFLIDSFCCCLTALCSLLLPLYSPVCISEFLDIRSALNQLIRSFHPSSKQRYARKDHSLDSFCSGDCYACLFYLARHVSALHMILMVLLMTTIFPCSAAMSTGSSIEPMWTTTAVDPRGVRRDSSVQRLEVSRQALLRTWCYRECCFRTVHRHPRRTVCSLTDIWGGRTTPSDIG